MDRRLLDAGLRQRRKDDHHHSGPEDAIAQHPERAAPVADADRGLQDMSEPEQTSVFTPKAL